MIQTCRSQIVTLDQLFGRDGRLIVLRQAHRQKTARLAQRIDGFGEEIALIEHDANVVEADQVSFA